MEVIPAVDLMGGKVVRLTKGNPATMKIYFENPEQAARQWAEEGANALHVVDLDAALSRGRNIDSIIKIIHSTRVPVQVGGGIRSQKTAEELFELGVERVIVGTLAFKKIEQLIELLADHGKERIVIALDYLCGEVMVKGWTTPAAITVDEALKMFLKVGIKLFLLTSISRDGLLTGPDYSILEGVVKHPEAEIFAAGGIGCLEDLVKLKEIGVRGVIVGKALYEKAFTLREAIEVSKVCKM